MGTSINGTPRREVEYCNLPLYAIKLDGVNDYLQTTQYNEFEYTQPFTFQFFGGYTPVGAGAAHALIDNRVPVTFRGIIVSAKTDGKIELLLTNTAPTSRMWVASTNASAGYSHFAITYDGSGNASGVSLFLDGASIPATIVNNTLAGTILTGGSSLNVGAKFPAASGNTNFPGTIEEISIVNYIKTAVEIETDFIKRTQSVGTGSWLLDPMRSIYPKPIITLFSADPFLDVNANRTYSIFGKPAEMDLSTDFELIT